jgi:hypothetical protein
MASLDAQVGHSVVQQGGIVSPVGEEIMNAVALV